MSKLKCIFAAVAGSQDSAAARRFLKDNVRAHDLPESIAKIMMELCANEHHNNVKADVLARVNNKIYGHMVMFLDMIGYGGWEDTGIGGENNCVFMNKDGDAEEYLEVCRVIHNEFTTGMVHVDLNAQGEIVLRLGKSDRASIGNFYDNGGLREFLPNVKALCRRVIIGHIGKIPSGMYGDYWSPGTMRTEDEIILWGKFLDKLIYVS